ncbi:MAG: 1,4-alpha-glucan branching protein GlgB, partial [Verrucomicrobiales bacterium]
FAFLGMHGVGEGRGVVVRAFIPGAARLAVVAAGDPALRWEAVRIHEAGFFEAVIAEAGELFDYRLAILDAASRGERLIADPYAYGEVLGEQDIHYFAEGSHRDLYRQFGAHGRSYGEITGMSFVVWAPNARRVSVVGDFNDWDGRVYPMRKRIEVGVWEIFLPGVEYGAHYKFEIVGADGSLFLKSDPVAFFSQHGESTASITYDLSRYQWRDQEWIKRREKSDYYHAAVSIYEVHLGSWARTGEDGEIFLTYLEMAERLVDYVVEQGFTHIELMPISEFPFDGSWGYQVGSYFAPTSRFGHPDEFRYFVDCCHQRGIGVILDWVPAHFPKDAHGLGRFDGTALYEHADPREGEHKDWGTLIFNFGRHEVANFLIANALFWIDEYHLDGIRVDAVASMIYRDYSREEGEWVPNQFGGRENFEAIDFLRHVNEACYDRFPGIMTIAEESTAFTGVSRPTSTGGLGFGFKWNMGWMHDFLEYMQLDPVHRRYHHGEATFSMIYAYHENFVLVLSHDEVVHGKGAMLDKMPGDRWQKFANLRMFYAWMFAHPGKKLLFQGAEIGQSEEWKHHRSLDWHLLQYPEHLGLQRLVRDLNHLYCSEGALHDLDHEPGGFQWLEHNDAENSTFAFLRRSRGGETIVFVVNATPVTRPGYRLGVPRPGRYEEVLNTDSELYAGSNVGNGGGRDCRHEPWQGQSHSIIVDLPPLAVLAFRCRG